MSVYNELLHRCIIIYTSICMYIMCICIDVYILKSVYKCMYIYITSQKPRCGGLPVLDRVLVVRG